MAHFRHEHANSLSNQMGIRFHSHSKNPEEKLRQLRGALYRKDATEYFTLAKELQVCTCEFCGLAIGDTTKRPTGLCGACWELNSRIDDANTLRYWAQMQKGRTRITQVLQLLQQILAETTQPPIDG